MTENLFDRVDVAQLECHFKWFKDLNRAFDGQWLSLLLSKQLHNDMRSTVNVGDNFEDHDDAVQDLPVKADKKEASVCLRKGLEKLSWKFTLILRNTFEKDFVEAYRLSTELWDFEEAWKRSQPQMHVDTWTYVLLANQLNILKEWRSSEECTVDDDQLAEMVTRIESLESVAKGIEAKAFMNIMKSNLSRDMQNSQLRVDFAEAATELNPQCSAWHLCYYLAMRYLRRSTGCCQTSPSQMEIDACEKAYKIASAEHADDDDLKIGYTIQMAKLYAELLLICHRGSREHQEITASAIKFARDVVQLKPDSKGLKMRLVTLLTGGQIYRRYPYNADQYIVEVRRLVNECEVGRCSSEICHRLAKFYSKPRLVEYDTAKALEWFERGLEANIGNFPCFADMLKNPIFRLKPTAEILQKIDTVLKSQSRTTFRAQLFFIKGFFLWTDDTEAGLQSFLMAMEECADLQINFVGLATLNFCYTNEGTCEKALEMAKSVKLFMGQDELADPVFAKFKDIVNAIIGHFDQELLLDVQARPNGRNYAQQRN